MNEYHLLVVRRIAQDKKDELGPRWTSWVGKAVRRLVRMPFDSATKSLSTTMNATGGARHIPARFKRVHSHDR